jgi:hypothetical protein
MCHAASRHKRGSRSKLLSSLRQLADESDRGVLFTVDHFRHDKPQPPPITPGDVKRSPLGIKWSAAVLRRAAPDMGLLPAFLVSAKNVGTKKLNSRTLTYCRRLMGQGYPLLPVGAATPGEVKDLRREASALKEVVADLTLENRLLKKSMSGDGEDEA